MHLTASIIFALEYRRLVICRQILNIMLIRKVVVVVLDRKMLCFKNIKHNFMEHNDSLLYQERQKNLVYDKN